MKHVGVESSCHKYLVRLFVHDKGKAFIGYCDGASFCGIMMMGMMMGILVVELVFRWWSKCISSVISRTASRNIFFSSTIISRTLNVDRVCPPNEDYPI